MLQERRLDKWFRLAYVMIVVTSNQTRDLVDSGSLRDRQPSRNRSRRLLQLPAVMGVVAFLAVGKGSEAVLGVAS